MFLNRGLFGAVGIWSGVGEGFFDSGIGLGDTDGVDFDKDEAGLVEVVSFEADVDLGDVGVDIRAVLVDVVGYNLCDVTFDIITRLIYTPRLLRNCTVSAGLSVLRSSQKTGTRFLKIQIGLY